MHERAEAVRQERQAALAEAGKVFLAENVKKEGVQVTESGLQYKVLKAGDGAIPARTDHVRCALYCL